MDARSATQQASGKKQKTLLDAFPSKRLEQAITFAKTAYGNQMSPLFEDETLLSHAVNTAALLVEFCPDEDALIACVLQHALSVPDGSLDEISKTFGRGVRDLISRIHLLSHLHTSNWRKSVEDMRTMLVSVSDDMRVLLIALAVQSYFMEHMDSLKSTYRMRLARQSLQLFAPVASRLGIYALKYRLERHAFPQCYASDADLIDTQLTQMHSEQGDFLPETAVALTSFLASEGIRAEVVAREKQPYSIFQKMQYKGVTDLGKISDLFAVRVVVSSVPDCYQTLGLLHRLATPLSHRFKDYISFPKPNGYQSLHTCLLGLPDAPKNAMVEVQIRTKEMHREAEYGIAAHWLYKEQGKGGVMQSLRQLHLSDVLQQQQAVGKTGSSDRTDNASRLVDHMYVLTPRGDIIELPDGGTPLDFAFILHTDLGLKFKAARVNGSIVPLSHRLENGDIVEILTHKHPRPTLQWLEELVTPSARSKLKAYFFSKNRSQYLLSGKETVNSELKSRGAALLDEDLTLLSKFDGKTIAMREREDLLVKIGMGSLRAGSILRHVPLKPAERRKPQIKRTGPVRTLKPEEMIAVEGQKLSMPYRFAKCCALLTASPRPEKITGVVTRNGFISVHRTGCRMIKSANPERTVKMKWIG